MRHCVRILLAFTRPYFGTANRRSKTFAVSTYVGGSISNSWIAVRPALRSRLSCARFVRISLARISAIIRWSRERSGAVACFVGVSLATGGIGGESTTCAGRIKPQPSNSPQARLEVERCRGSSRRYDGFAGVLIGASGYGQQGVLKTPESQRGRIHTGAIALDGDPPAMLTRRGCAGAGGGTIVRCSSCNEMTAGTPP